jgi:hypothetical protein
MLYNSLSIVQMPFDRVAYAKIPCNLLDIRKLQSLLETALLVNDIVGSRMLVGSIQDGFSETVDIVIGDSFRVGKFPRYLDRHSDLKGAAFTNSGRIPLYAGRMSDSLRRYSDWDRDR